MKASPRQQQLLLELQELDTSILRAIRQIRVLKETPELKALEEKREERKKDFFEKQKTFEEITAEIARFESDVQLVRERSKVTTERLSASSQAKEALALQEELDALARRASVLEDKELELMEESEKVEKVLEEAETGMLQLEEELSQLKANIDEQVDTLVKEKAAIQEERSGVSAEITTELRELYDRIGERYGIAVAKLEGKVSGGSNMELDAADFAEAMRTPADEIYFCPTSGVILVRQTDAA